MSQSEAPDPFSSRVDRLGVLASGLCAAHCAVCALLPVTLGVLGVQLAGENVEWTFTLVAVAFALTALILGWRRHGSALIAGLLGLGIVGLLASRGLESLPHGTDGDPDTSAREHAGALDDHGHSKAPEEHACADDDHDDTTHIAGAVIGVLSGLLLLAGHALSFRETRKRACCTAASAATPATRDTRRS